MKDFNTYGAQVR